MDTQRWDVTLYLFETGAEGERTGNVVPVPYGKSLDGMGLMHAIGSAGSMQDDNSIPTRYRVDVARIEITPSAPVPCDAGSDSEAAGIALAATDPDND